MVQYQQNCTRLMEKKLNRSCLGTPPMLFFCWVGRCRRFNDYSFKGDRQGSWFFYKIGVKTNKIFIIGQSRGGWSTLYFAAKIERFTLGGIVAINPSICSNNYDKCSHINEENISLFEKSTVPGLMISHQKEKYSRARQREFAKNVKSLKFISNFCNKRRRVGHMAQHIEIVEWNFLMRFMILSNPMVLSQWNSAITCRPLYRTKTRPWMCP